MTDRPKNSLEQRLNKHPHLKNRIEQLLKIVENADGDLKKADEAEKRYPFRGYRLSSNLLMLLCIRFVI